MKNCIFCKIVKNKIPSYKIYEDKKTFAFLDINPLTLGHTLVIPKKHYENIFDCKDKVLADCMKTIQKISLHYKETLNCTGINILQSSGKSAQQEVLHIHFHIIPRYEEDGLKLVNKTTEIKEDINELHQKLKLI